jgi:hypothetical protein
MLVMLGALSAAGQEEGATLGWVFFDKPKAGMEQQYEEALKAHMAWHGQQKDTWEWHTWLEVNGEELGSFVIGTFGHTWEEFDARTEFQAKDAADAVGRLGPYSQTVTNAIDVYRADLSRPPEGEAPLPLMSVVLFNLKVGAESDFTHYIRKVHEAIGKTNWPTRYIWRQLVNGGDLPQFILILPRKNWAGFKPPEKSFQAMLEEAYGREEAASLLRLYRKSVRSVRNSILQHRPDLSYVPAAK